MNSYLSRAWNKQPLRRVSFNRVNSLGVGGLCQAHNTLHHQTHSRGAGPLLKPSAQCKAGSAGYCPALPWPGGTGTGGLDRSEAESGVMGVLIWKDPQQPGLRKTSLGAHWAALLSFCFPVPGYTCKSCPREYSWCTAGRLTWSSATDPHPFPQRLLSTRGGATHTGTARTQILLGHSNGGEAGPRQPPALPPGCK